MNFQFFQSNSYKNTNFHIFNPICQKTCQKHPGCRPLTPKPQKRRRKASSTGCGRTGSLRIQSRIPTRTRGGEDTHQKGPHPQGPGRIAKPPDTKRQAARSRGAKLPKAGTKGTRHPRRGTTPRRAREGPAEERALMRCASGPTHGRKRHKGAGWLPSHGFDAGSPLDFFANGSIDDFSFDLGSWPVDGGPWPLELCFACWRGPTGNLPKYIRGLGTPGSSKSTPRSF